MYKRKKSSKPHPMINGPVLGQILGSLENQNLLPPLLKQAPWSSVFTVSAIRLGFGSSREGSNREGSRLVWMSLWPGLIFTASMVCPSSVQNQGDQKELRLVVLKEWLLG